MTRLLLITVFFTTIQIGHAETMGTTASWFVDYCAGQLHVKTTETGEEQSVWWSAQGNYCAGYLNAARESFQFTVIPDGASMLGRDIINLHKATWVYAVFAEYLSRHPEMIQGSPYFVIVAALRERVHWTCDGQCRSAGVSQRPGDPQ